MKKRILILFALVFVLFGLAACKKKPTPTPDPTPDPTPEVTDTIAPLLTVDPKTVSLEYKQEYDLMTGVSARDNVDGTITDKVEINKGGFDSSVPGVYTITYTVKDEAGNESTETRTITVHEKRVTIQIDENHYTFVYNPRMNPNSNYFYPFDLTTVSVFDKAYADWLVENAPQRFAAFWSVVAITDSNFKVVQLRDFNTNQFDENGSMVATEWSTGTATTANKPYEFRGGMLANLNIPEGGYVIVFINDGVNGLDSPRTFGSKLVDKSLEVVGFEIKINNLEDEPFDINNAPPLIKLEDELPENARAYPTILVEEGFDPTELFGADLLDGVSVYHETETLSAQVEKMYYLDSEGEEVVVTLQNIDTTVENRIYFIKYVVEDSKGNKDVEYRSFKIIAAEEPEVVYDEVIIGDQIHSLVINFDFGDGDLASKNTAWNSFTAANGQAMMFTKEYLTSIDDYQNLEVGYGIVAVTDEFGKVSQVRVFFKGGLMITYVENDYVLTPYYYTNKTFTGIGLADIPEGGYVFLFAAQGAENAREFGFENILGLLNEGAGFDWSEPDFVKEDINVNPFADGFRIKFTSEDFVQPEESPKEGFLVVGDLIYLLERNFHFTNQLNLVSDRIFLLEKAYLESLEDFGIEEEFVEVGGKYYKMPWGGAAILDANMKLVELLLPSNASAVKLNGEGEMQIYPWAFTGEHLEYGLPARIPEGGYVLTFQHSGATGAGGPLDFGYEAFLGINKAEFEANGLENATINPFEEGFNIDTIFPREDVLIVGNRYYTLEKNFHFTDQLNAVSDRIFILQKAYLDDLRNFGDNVEYVEVGGRYYKMPWGGAAILDANMKLVELLLPSNASAVKLNGEGEMQIYPWAFTGEHLEYGLPARIPEGGYVLTFQHSGATGAGGPLDFGYEAFLGINKAEFEANGLENATINPFAAGFKIQAFVDLSPFVPTVVDQIIIDDYTFPLLLNNDFKTSGGIGAITDKLLVFEESYLSSLPGFASSDKTEWDEGRNYTIQFSVVVVTDKYGQIVQVRDYFGNFYAWDEDEEKIVVTYGAMSNGTLQLGLLDVVPKGGYVFVFQNTGVAGNPLRAKGIELFVGFADDTEFRASNAAKTLADDMPVNPFKDFLVRFTLHEIVQEEPLNNEINVDGYRFPLLLNNDFKTSGGIGAITDKLLVFEESYLSSLPGFASSDKTEWDEGRNYTIQFSVVVVTDKDGRVVQVRDYFGNFYAWDEDEEKIVVTYGAMSNGTLQLGLLDVVPEGGYVFVFQNTGVAGNPLRAKGIELFVGFADDTEFRASNAAKTLADDMPVNPFVDFVVEFQVD